MNNLNEICAHCSKWVPNNLSTADFQKILAESPVQAGEVRGQRQCSKKTEGLLNSVRGSSNCSAPQEMSSKWKPNT